MKSEKEKMISGDPYLASGDHWRQRVDRRECGDESGGVHWGDHRGG